VLLQGQRSSRSAVRVACSGCRTSKPTWPVARSPWRRPSAQASTVRAGAASLQAAPLASQRGLRERLETAGLPVVANRNPLRLVLNTAAWRQRLVADDWVERAWGESRAARTWLSHLCLGQVATPLVEGRRLPVSSAGWPRAWACAAAGFRRAGCRGGRAGACPLRWPGVLEQRARTPGPSSGPAGAEPLCPLSAGHIPCSSPESGSIRGGLSGSRSRRRPSGRVRSLIA